MGTLIKIGIGIALLGALAYSVLKNAANFSFSIVGYGAPSVNGWNVSLPVTLRFVNPLPLSVSIDQVLATVFLQKDNQWVQVGQVKQPITIATKSSDIKINAQINLQSFLSGNPLNALKSLLNAMQSRSIPVLTKVVATYHSVTLPEQSIISNVNLPI